MAIPREFQGEFIHDVTTAEYWQAFLDRPTITLGDFAETLAAALFCTAKDWEEDQDFLLYELASFNQARVPPEQYIAQQKKKLEIELHIIEVVASLAEADALKVIGGDTILISHFARIRNLLTRTEDTARKYQAVADYLSQNDIRIRPREAVRGLVLMQEKSLLCPPLVDMMEQTESTTQGKKLAEAKSVNEETALSPRCKKEHKTVSIEKAAQILNCSMSTIKRYDRGEGTLVELYPGRNRVIPLQQFAATLRAHKAQNREVRAIRNAQQGYDIDEL